MQHWSPISQVQAAIEPGVRFMFDRSSRIAIIRVVEIRGRKLLRSVTYDDPARRVLIGYFPIDARTRIGDSEIDDQTGVALPLKATGSLRTMCASPARWTARQAVERARRCREARYETGCSVYPPGIFSGESYGNRRPSGCLDCGNVGSRLSVCRWADPYGSVAEHVAKLAYLAHN